MSVKAIHVCIIIMTALFFLCSCENSIEEIKKATGINKKLQIEEAIDVSSYLSQSGDMRAHLTAPLMYNYHTDSPYIEFPKRLHVDFYKDSLVIESIVDAKYSRYLTNEAKILLRDSVVVHNLLTGDSLKTNEMWWDQRKQLFYGNKPVVMFITGLQQNLKGSGFTAKQDLSKWSLMDSTTGNMRVPGDMGLP